MKKHVLGSASLPDCGRSMIGTPTATAAQM